MNSDFPMTFASDSQEPSHDSGAQKASDKQHGRGSNVIPLSRGNVTFIPLSEAMPLSEAVSSRKVNNDNSMAGDYPLSEFHDEDSSSGSSSRPQSKTIVRGVMLSLMLGLWVAVGTGHLNSSTPGISHLRSVFSLSDSSSISSSPISNDTATGKSELSPSDLAPAALHPSNETLIQRTEGDLKNPSGSKLSGSQSPAPELTPSDASSQSLASGSVRNDAGDAIIAVSKVSKSESSAQSQIEIEAMARLYLSQLEQFNATEEHLVRLVLAHASQSERDAFLAGLQKKHESALSKLQGQRQNSAR